MERRIARVRVSSRLLEIMLFEPQDAALKTELVNPHILGIREVDYMRQFEFKISAENLPELQDGGEIPELVLAYKKTEPKGDGEEEKMAL